MPLFSEREIRGVALFVPLALLAVGVLLLATPRTDPAAAVASGEAFTRAADTLRPRPFDPNTADYDQLRALGLSPAQAASLLKYRAAGKRFRIPEDVATCYGIGDSLFRALRPWIRIDSAYAIRPVERPRRGRSTFRTTKPAPLPVARFRIDTVSAAYLCAIGAFTRRQAEVVIARRNVYGFRDMEELRACYVVSDSVAAALEPYILFPDRVPDPAIEPIELNAADSATLRRVVGIGEKSVVAILRYRERLGGFLRVEQLAEVREVTEANYERILKQIRCDSCKIRKIGVNFASPNELARHPYVPPRVLRRLLKARALKGGWSTAREFTEDDILTLTREERMRLLPYLSFDAAGGNEDPR